ncbi:MAG: polyprenyl diphosphate synthase [Candidatus Rifleibacteriota bacterium]
MSREQLKKELEARLDRSKMPTHIGIIMDGNGRWAKSLGKSRLKGHQQGARRIKAIIRYSNAIGIKHVSLYAFSVENWSRPPFEVYALMKLLKTYLIQQRNELHEEGVVFRLVGRRDNLPAEIVKEAEISTKLMQNNTGLNLNLCFNYGGRAEIVDAVKKIVQSGISPDRITEETIRQNLYWPEIPDVDLMIRTSGEMRTSNFHLWRCAYSELYFTPVFWPDFDEAELLNAILTFQGRERRFGLTSAQLGSQES